MKHTLLTFSLLTLSALPAAAQTDWLNAQLEFRADYTYTGVDGQTQDKGFKGQYLNLKLSGKINDHFSYNYRQRFSKDLIRSGGFLNATDFLYLTYHPTKDWGITAGKQFIWIGGYEYDYAPIDVYQYTEYCQFIRCYGYGVSVDYNITPNDNILVQAIQSAFADPATDNCFSYNVKWTGTHGCFTGLYSLGMHETVSGDYITCIGLGNRFKFPYGHLVLDYTNRFANVNDANFFGDFTLMSELHVQPIPQLNIFAHYAHNHNDANTIDTTVRPGTSLNSLGGGVEFFPIKGDHDVRFHCAYFHNFGTNGNVDANGQPGGVILPNQDYVTAGITFRINAKKICDYYKNKKS